MEFPFLSGLALSVIHSCILVLTDLARMYSLVSRIPNGLGELMTLLEQHIYNQGLAAIEKCGDTAVNVSDRPSETL